ncbi:MAG: hypothetical protein QMC36_07675 [Patescibacteria group bacterium]
MRFPYLTASATSVAKTMRSMKIDVTSPVIDEMVSHWSQNA